VQFLEVIRREWGVIKEAPWSFVAAVTLAAVGIWFAMQWRYSGIIDKQDHELAEYRQKEQLAAQLGTSGGIPQAPSQATTKESITWTENAHLTLTFDGTLQHASETAKEGIEYYYWYSVPALEIDWKKHQYRGAPGYVVIFMTLKHPTYTNYNRCRVIGTDIQCDVLDHQADGAAVRIIGDLRGKSVDVRFSKNPILD
jgi:hypothetical protein